MEGKTHKRKLELDPTRRFLLFFIRFMFHGMGHDVNIWGHGVKIWGHALVLSNLCLKDLGLSFFGQQDREE